MELKDFIKTAITDITDAISDLQQELDNGTIINPKLTYGKESTSLIDGDNRSIERLNFDIAVTVSSSSDIEGGAKAGISVFGAKLGGKTSESSENASRLTFSIPIVFPYTDKGTDVCCYGVSVDQYKPKRPKD